MPTLMLLKTKDNTAVHLRHAHYWLLPLGGLLLSLAFPNDLLHGRLGDHPPFLLAWLALLPLLWGVLALPARQARLGVWLYGLVFYLGTLSWMRLFGVVPWLLLAGYMSLTPLLALLLTQRMPRRRWLIPLGFALAWSGLEWLRGQGFLGFPWSEVGASQVDGATAQIAALGGVPLLSFLLLWLTGTLLQQLLDRKFSRALTGVALGVFLLCMVVGAWQTHAAWVRWRRQPATLHLALIQPDTLRGLSPEDLLPPETPEQQATWERKRQQRQEVLLDLSSQADAAFRRQGLTDHDLRLMIWPETAQPEPPGDLSTMEFSMRTQSHLLIGAPAWDYDEHTQSLFPRNSAYLLAPGGTILARYDKMHLVPFGEFVPLRSFVQKYFIVRPTDIRPGAIRKIMPFGTHRLGVGICFESTFSAVSREYARLGAQVLVIITNDAWFHQTLVVRQHLNHARFRAIETGLPVARTAATGISAFVAPDGRLLEEIPTYTAGMRARSLPPGIPGTCFTLCGWLFAPAALLAALLLALLGFLQGRKGAEGNSTAQRHQDTAGNEISG